MQFGAVYLNFSVATADQRAQELATYLPSAVISANPQLGWDGSGGLRLESEQVAGISVQDRARGGDPPGQRERYAHAAGCAHLRRERRPGGLRGARLAGRSAAGVPACAAAAASDPAAQSALNAQLPAFFQAYASGEARR